MSREQLSRFQNGGIQKHQTPSGIPPVDVDFYAAISFSHLMPNAVNLSDEIQNMNSHAAMLSKQHKTNPKMSAYTLDPISVEECKKSEDWSAPQQGNSWKQTIMSKIDNLVKFKVQHHILIGRAIQLQNLSHHLYIPHQTH